MRYLLVSLPNTGEKLIIAEQLASSVLSNISLSLETLQSTAIPGTDLLNSTYLNPLTPTEPPMPILPAAYVTSDSGTGLVHSAPGHGAEDYSLFRDRNVVPFSPVDGDGKYTDSVHPESLRGLSVLKEGNETVVKLLRESGELLQQHMYTHKYPYDWRSKEPVIVRATEQWFASVENIKEDAIKAIGGVKMIPRTGILFPLPTLTLYSIQVTKLHSGVTTDVVCPGTESMVYFSPTSMGSPYPSVIQCRHRGSFTDP